MSAELHTQVREWLDNVIEWGPEYRDLRKLDAILKTHEQPE